MFDLLTLLHVIFIDFTLQAEKEQMNQMICSKESDMSAVEESLQAELSQWKAAFQKTKAEEESLQKCIYETRQALQQERQVHEDTKRTLENLEVSGKSKN